MNNNGLTNQQVIHNNEEIVARIKSELLKANSEILIVTAWFTDDELFDILLKKVDEGVKVEIIIADNEDNKKLDFSKIIIKGASVLKIQKSGYGMMHHKFCVVDRKIALNGSYNWTLNARRNNQEHIIVTDHKETIDKFISIFSDLKHQAFQIQDQAISNRFTSIFKTIFRKKEVIPSNGHNKLKEQIPSPQNVYINEKASQSSKTDYEHVLDSMIAAEVSNFDRPLLRQQGYDRAKANNGDHQILYKALDSLYAVFINEVEIVEDKKQRLTAKIEEQKIKSIDALNETSKIQINGIEAEAEASNNAVSNKINNIRSQISIHEKEIDSLRNNKITLLEEKEQSIEQNIKASEKEFVKPAFKWFEFIPTLLINVGLILYLFFFYSSAAYILIFGKTDAEEARLMGVTVNPPEVFNPEAIHNALEKGGTRPLFILLFVFLPLTYALMGRFTKDKWWIHILSFIFGIVIIDGAIAYKVAESIHDVLYLIGDEDSKWQYNMVFTNPNFYLVFILGAFGLVAFKFTFGKLMAFFEDRNPDVQAQRNKVQIQQYKQELAETRKKITDHKEEIKDHEKEIIQSKTEIGSLEDEIKSITSKKVLLSENKKTELVAKIQTIEQITDIYKTHIENETLPISVDSMKDRINVFLEGWNDFLHEEYAVAKAVEKSGKARDVADQWQAEKLLKQSN